MNEDFTPKEKALSRRIKRAADLQWRANQARAAVQDEMLARYGVSYNEHDVDEIIDSLDYGQTFKGDDPLTECDEAMARAGFEVKKRHDTSD